MSYKLLTNWKAKSKNLIYFFKDVVVINRKSKWYIFILNIIQGSVILTNSKFLDENFVKSIFLLLIDRYRLISWNKWNRWNILHVWICKTLLCICNIYSHSQWLFYEFIINFTNKLVKQSLRVTVCRSNKTFTWYYKTAQI